MSEPSLAAPWLRRIFAIDTRALAALRIGLALVMLWDLGERSTHLIEHYADTGASPRELFLTSRTAFTSLYFLNGSAPFIAALFALHASFALALLVGWQTRLATFACAVMQWSLVSRNPMLCHSGDGLCAWLLIWGLFLPLGAVGSIDSRTSAARGAAPPPRSISSVASAALLLQVVFLYLCAAASKSSPDWRINHSAVYRFLVCHIGTPLGHDLSRFYGMCEWLTVTTLFLETFAPTIALLSAPLPWLRVIIALGFMVFHLCLVATLYVGTFAFVCMIAWFAYLPSEFWDALQRWRPIRAVYRTWARLLDAGAALLLRAAPVFAVSRIRSQPGWVGTIVASLLLAHVAVVNLVQAFGAPGPLARFVEKAKLKQTWTVMSRAETVYARLFVEAELEDGSRIVLMSPPPDGGFWRRLWAPSDARTVNYLPSLLVYSRYADAFCRYYWRLTDTPGALRLPRRAIVLMYEWREIPPPGVGGNWPLKQGRTEVYRVSAAKK